jgi:hypothetical protein
MAGFQLAGPAADVSKSLYGENRKSYQSPNAQYTFDHFEGSRSCEVLKIASSGRGEPNINPGLRNGELWGTGVIVLRVWALVRFAIFTIQNFRHICSRACELKSSHLGTKIAITF